MVQEKRTPIKSELQKVWLRYLFQMIETNTIHCSQTELDTFYEVYKRDSYSYSDAVIMNHLLKKHPLKKMMELGLKVTINSDDPAYFGGQVNKNYIEIQKALNLSKENLYQLAKNSFEYSFLNADKKEFYLNELETYYLNNK